MKSLIFTILLLTNFVSAMASSIRFTDLESKDLNSILSGLGDHIIEFKKDDLIHFNINIKGDLLSIIKNGNDFIKVEKDFFIKAKDSKILISFDGESYFPLKEALTGSLTINASGDTIPNMLNILLEVDER